MEVVGGGCAGTGRVIKGMVFTRRVKFPKSGRHKERGIVAHEDGVVAKTFHLSLYVW